MLKTRWTLLQAKREAEYRRMSFGRHNVPDADELDILEDVEPDEHDLTKAAHIIAEEN